MATRRQPHFFSPTRDDHSTTTFSFVFTPDGSLLLRRFLPERELTFDRSPSFRFPGHEKKASALLKFELEIVVPNGAGPVALPTRQLVYLSFLSVHCITFHYIDDTLPFRFGGTDFPIDDFTAVCLLVYFGVTTLLDATSDDGQQSTNEQKENMFELAPQSETAVMNSISQKWQDFKNKLTSRFVWPNKDNPEKLSSSPSQYQILKAVWKAFVDERLHPSWEVRTHMVLAGNL
ncbi:hypothetical protein ZIOFF_010089 [Zingiber officinale]|uniref:Uncharacterized protein n=1 Tax=Zingiber officinale TaxID=94328 RepID=A0A8J5HLQ4_ZINOF|nr:hypothetical protein ZIOFF_010089 [Zingiber officinale]